MGRARLAGEVEEVHDRVARARRVIPEEPHEPLRRVQLAEQLTHLRCLRCTCLNVGTSALSGT